jgi:type IV secretory pathway TrbD component
MQGLFCFFSKIKKVAIIFFPRNRSAALIFRCILELDVIVLWSVHPLDHAAWSIPGLRFIQPMIFFEQKYILTTKFVPSNFSMKILIFSWLYSKDPVFKSVFERSCLQVCFWKFCLQVWKICLQVSIWKSLTSSLYMKDPVFKSVYKRPCLQVCIWKTLSSSLYMKDPVFKSVYQRPCLQVCIWKILSSSQYMKIPDF